MTLVKYRPNKYNRPFDNLFDELFRGDISQMFGSNDVSGFAPKVNIKERENDYQLEMLVPGLGKEDIEITVDDNTLSVSGKVEKEELKENEKYTRKEHTLNSFVRKFNLPEEADLENIKAGFENGILTVTVPRVTEPQKITRTISIG